MPAVLKEIDEMDIAEKVQTMDYLWSSLQTASSGYTPPAWHGEELSRRQHLYAEGKVPVYDWIDVKARLDARRAALGK
ncbi:MAG: addiction module protein [Lentisphaeria bacterium]|nr:addiction module protein [Lentisphaeria bacterium]